MTDTKPDSTYKIEWFEPPFVIPMLLVAIIAFMAFANFIA